MLCLPALQNTKKTQRSVAWKPQHHLRRPPLHFPYTEIQSNLKEIVSHNLFQNIPASRVLTGAAIKGSPPRLSTWVCSDPHDKMCQLKHQLP